MWPLEADEGLVARSSIFTGQDLPERTDEGSAALGHFVALRVSLQSLCDLGEEAWS